MDWPAADAVAVATSLLPKVAGPKGLRLPGRPPRMWSVEVGPGLVRVRHGERLDWEPADDPTPSKLLDLDDEDRPRELPFDEVEDDPATGRGLVAGWSPRSRSRLVQRIAATDLTPILDRDGHRHGLVTLTYPGDWRAVCPDPATFRRHLNAFRRRLERQLRGPVSAVWKMEFQRRGAPHIHIGMAVPLGTLSWREGRGRNAPERTGTFRQWLSWTWADIVSASGDEYDRHLLAGTAVDFAQAAKNSDPKRLAIYFTRHTVKGGKSKAYQHRVPEGWENPGRWWGFWHLDPCTATVEVSEQTAVEAMRIARRMVERRYVDKVVRRVDQRTGVVRTRKVRRRFRVRALHQPQGASVVLNDAPAFITAFALYLGRCSGASVVPASGAPLTSVSN